MTNVASIDRKTVYEAALPDSGDVWLDKVEAHRDDLRNFTTWLAASQEHNIDGDELVARGLSALAQTVELLDEVAQLRRRGEIAWE